MRVRLSLMVLLAVSTVALPAQQPAPANPDAPPIFRTSADLVTIDAVVTDGDGRHVTDLTAADFEVTVSGKTQELQQAVYVKTADQPRVLAAARAAAATPAAGLAEPVTPERSEASAALRKTGLQIATAARTIALVVDDLGLSFRSVHDVRKALHKYIDTQMQPGDLVAIVRTAGGIGALQQFTTDKRLLHMAAERVQWDFRSRHRVEWYEPAGTTSFIDDFPSRESTDLRDAMTSVGSFSALEYIARGVAELPGRKCIVFLSDGFEKLFVDRGESGRMWYAMSRMLSRANAAGVVVYTIDAGGLTSGGLTAEDNPQRTQVGNQGPYDAEALIREAGTARLDSVIDSQESLHFIAHQTGGLAIANTNDLNLGISRVLEDQKGYYLLGYVAPKGAARSGWDQNRVKVRVKRPGLRVRARQGFFGPTDANEPDPWVRDPLTMAALSPFGSGAMSVRLTALFGHDVKAGPYIRSLLFIDSSDIRFEQNGEEHATSFKVLLLAVGDNGEVVQDWGRRMQLSLKPEEYRRVRERGIVVTLRSPIKEPGAYQVRAAVQDLASNAIGSASQFLEVPRVGKGRLALSGVLLKGVAESEAIPIGGAAGEAGAEGLAEAVLLQPEVRVLEPGTDAVFAYEIYDGLKAEEAARLQMATALLRDGKVVYRSEFAPVAAKPREKAKVRAIPVAGKLALGKDMPAGPYTLEVIVRGKDAKKLEHRQWLDFEIKR